ncbi:MAG: helix-turn-helix domain-containing protein [Caulobacteraceae bacterium]
MPLEGKVLRKVAAANIRQARQSMGVSQEALAAEAGLHRTFIGHVEQGRSNISVDNLEKIAIALNIEAYRLLVPQGHTPSGLVVAS